MSRFEGPGKFGEKKAEGRKREAGTGCVIDAAEHVFLAAKQWKSVTRVLVIFNLRRYVHVAEQPLLVDLAFPPGPLRLEY